VGKLSRFETKILGAATRESVRNGMMQLMNDDTQGFAEQFPQLGEHIGHLRLSGGLPGDACIAYLQAFQSQLTMRAAELSRLTLNSPFAPNLDVRIDLPDTMVLVDALVSRLMEGILREPGKAEYVAVSDISTWLNLPRLAGMHKNAIKDVRTRRVFVLGLNSDRHLSADRIHQILEDHIQSAIGSKYEMRLLMLDDYPRAGLLELSEAKHFGIFFPQEHQAIALIARDDGISRLRLVTAHDEMRNEFDAIWLNAESVTATPQDAETNAGARGQRSSDIILDDYLMAYFISRPVGDIDYHGISYMSSWLRNDYRVFFKASQKALLRDGARAKRIFVMEGIGEKDSRVQAVIEQHAQLSKRTGGNYEFGFCPTFNEQAFPDKIPIGFLKSADPNEPNKIIVDRAQPRSFKPASDDQNQQLVAAFDELWNKYCRKPAVGGAG
jgi:hypothetical protein